jgi:hypothetical protein
VEEADLLTMFSEILSKPRNTIKIYREREAYTAAKQLFEGYYNFIAVYENEPSTLVDELQINLTEELHAQAAILLPLDKGVGQLRNVSTQRLQYLFFTVPDDPFFAIPGIVQKSSYDFPVLLSNVSSTLPDSVPAFSRILSDAYFLMPLEIEKLAFRNEVEKQSVQRLYYWNAYLNDPENRYKSLGMLGELLLLKGRTTNSSRLKEIYSQKCTLFLKKLKLSRVTAETLFEWLDLKPPRINRRDLFTDDVSRLYQNAIESIEEGLKSRNEKRRESFEKARGLLIAALRQADEPKNVQGSRGLWSIENYNPYYQLARVTLYLQNEAR